MNLLLDPEKLLGLLMSEPELSRGLRGVLPDSNEIVHAWALSLDEDVLITLDVTEGFQSANGVAVAVFVKGSEFSVKLIEGAVDDKGTITINGFEFDAEATTPLLSADQLLPCCAGCIKQPT